MTHSSWSISAAVGNSLSRNFGVLDDEQPLVLTVDALDEEADAGEGQVGDLRHACGSDRRQLLHLNVRSSQWTAGDDVVDEDLHRSLLQGSTQPRNRPSETSRPSSSTVKPK